MHQGTDIALRAGCVEVNVGGPSEDSTVSIGQFRNEGGIVDEMTERYVVWIGDKSVLYLCCAFVVFGIDAVEFEKGVNPMESLDGKDVRVFEVSHATVTSTW